VIRRDADRLLAFVTLWESKIADGQWDAWTRMVRGFALKVDDPVVVKWLQTSASREHIEGVLANIRDFIAVGNIEQAEITADRFEALGQHIDRLIKQRWTETGNRMLERDDKGGRPKETDRDVELAREYQLRSQGERRMSDTSLKVEIGGAVGLKRSAAIEAVNRGLRILQGQ
jgi:hypothetical protein